MKTLEALKAFLQVPELITVGSAQERAAFIAIRLEGRTVRQAGEALGISKSQVTNLAEMFQSKLALRMIELGKKGRTVSAKYLTLRRELENQLWTLSEESGSDLLGLDCSIAASREDLAECFGQPSPRFDDE